MRLLELATTFAVHSPPADQPAHFTHGSDLCSTVYRHVVAAESCKGSTPDRSCRCCGVGGVCCIREEVCAGCGCGAHMPQYCPRAAAVSMHVPAQNSRCRADSFTLFCGARRPHRLPGRLQQQCNSTHFKLYTFRTINTYYCWYADCKIGPHMGHLQLYIPNLGQDLYLKNG